MLLLHHLHCSHFIVCTPIASSHTVVLNLHKRFYYFVTYCFTTYTALTSSHALLLLPHIRCSCFITYTTPTSSQAMLVPHHMHCSYSNTCTALPSSQALLSHHMHCYHYFTYTVWTAGIEPTATDLDFFFDGKRKRKKRQIKATAQLRARPERKDGGHPALCNAPPQWLRMRHQSHQSQWS